MNLFQKIVEVRKVIDVMKKEGKSFNYSYVKGSQILGIIKEKMDELGLILSPEIGDVKTPYLDEYETTNKNNQTKQHRDWITEGYMSYTFINSENPEEKHTCKWWFTGAQDDPSKSFGSALTYSERYFLLKFFGVATDDDDPDGKEPKNSTKSGYKFGSAKDEKLPWVKDEQVKAMVKAITDGKKQDVINSLVKYKWSKTNKELITSELNKQIWKKINKN